MTPKPITYKRCEVINCENRATVLDNGTYGAGHVCRECYSAIQEEYAQRHHGRG